MILRIGLVVSCDLGIFKLIKDPDIHMFVGQFWEVNAVCEASIYITDYHFRFEAIEVLKTLLR
jgi:hypothetical protein